MHDTKAMRSCIEACHECEDACRTTLTHCLEKGGEHAAPDHVALLLDCAEICANAAAFMARGSTSHARLCALCAEVCDACAKSCDALGDREMKACAETCRACARECRAMAGVAA